MEGNERYLKQEDTYMTSIKEYKREVLKDCENFYEDLKEIISTDYGYGDYSGIIAAIDDEEKEFGKPINHLPVIHVNEKRCLTYEGLFNISKMIADDLEENVLVEIGIASQYGVNLQNQIDTENTFAQIEALRDLCRALAEAYVYTNGIVSIIETVEAILDEHVEVVRQLNGNMTDFTNVLRYDVVDLHRLYCQSGEYFDVDQLNDTEKEMLSLFTHEYFSSLFSEII